MQGEKKEGKPKKIEVKPKDGEDANTQKWHFLEIETGEMWTGSKCVLLVIGLASTCVQKATPAARLPRVT